MEETAYRVVQEALTNTRRHAGPARASVMVAYAENGLDLTVADDGSGPGGARGSGGDTGGAGHGLVGMRERVDALGGVIDAGAGPAGGFVVRAHLPGA